MQDAEDAVRTLDNSTIGGRTVSVRALYVYGNILTSASMFLARVCLRYARPTVSIG